MKTKITAVYEDSRGNSSSFKATRGMSWLLEFKHQKILFDTGTRGRVLLHNLKQLNLHPDDIDMIILSHAHIDHTGGLSKFLENRTEQSIPILAHPAILEPKRAFFMMSIGLPKLKDTLWNKMSLNLRKYPVSVNPFLHTTGEINNRPYHDGTGWIMQHFIDGRWKRDPLLDDVSLVLETNQGIVLICGCCHAGLLNTLNHVKELFNQRISMILGGTHMRSFSKERLEEVVLKLETQYNHPKLVLGHCTGKKQLQSLMNYFGPEIVQPLFVGWKLEVNARTTLKQAHFH